jgi:hypothetical protein
MLKNEKIRMIGERFELSVRRLCRRIPSDRRATVILAMLLLFGGGAIGMTFSSVYRYGKYRGLVEYFIDEMRVERLRSTPLLPEPEPGAAADTLNLENGYDDESAGE